MAATAAHILVSDVSKTYSTDKTAGVLAIRHADFEVKKGEFVSILGPSGCGKSSLLMMIAGLEQVTKGEIKIDDQVITAPRLNTGIMFQDATLLPWKTVLDNVLFPITIQRRPIGDYIDKANELLALTGLSDFAHSKPKQLSGGMRQRAAICRSLIYDPDVLLMDEPFSALDAITRDELGDALLNIWQLKPKTGLFVTHSIREAAYLSDRILVMSNRPATIVADIEVPFKRPRSSSVQASKEFVELCEFLKSKINHKHD